MWAVLSDSHFGEVSSGLPSRKIVWMLFDFLIIPDTAALDDTFGIKTRQMRQTGQSGRMD